MIFDLLENYIHYPLGSAWTEAFRFLTGANTDLAAGRYPLQGDDLFAIVMDYETQSRQTAELEAHRRYLDIQTLLSGSENVACHFTPELAIRQPYDAGRDVELYAPPTGSPACFLLVPGTFLTFFPQDAHMPCLHPGSTPEPVRKVVIKMAMDLLRRTS